MNKRLLNLLSLCLVFMFAFACSPARSESTGVADTTPVVESSPVDASKLSNSVKWSYLSDEYKLCCLEAYESGSARLPGLVKGMKPGTWCVVVDMDETIVSNVEAQVILETTGEKYSRENWVKWCNMQKCTPLEGALEFNALVKKLGGHYIVITNRGAEEEASTIGNLDKLGFKYDAVLFKAGTYANDETKQWRRDDVMKGKVKNLPSGKKLPPMEIVMLAGDQLSDLYDPVCFNMQDMKSEFTKRMILLPNSMYGYWEQNYKSFYNRKVKVGEEFCIWLKSNITTGYSWNLDPSINASVVSKVSDEYKAPDTNACGAGGVEVWKFKAVGKGKVRIILNYLRPFEKGVKPVDIREFNITVE